MQQVLIEFLQCASHCAKYQVYSGDQAQIYYLPCETYNLLWEVYIKVTTQINVLLQL